jgi:hypothetical protein
MRERGQALPTTAAVELVKVGGVQGSLSPVPLVVVCFLLGALVMAAIAKPTLADSQFVD